VGNVFRRGKTTKDKTSQDKTSTTKTQGVKKGKAQESVSVLSERYVLCQTQDLWSNSREVGVCFSFYAFATILLSEQEIKKNRKCGENSALVEGAFFVPHLFWPPFIFACQRVFRLRVASCYQNLSPQPFVVLLAALIRQNSREAFTLFSHKDSDLLPHPPFPFHKLPAASVCSAF